MNIKDTDIGRLWPWTVPDPLDMPLSWQTSTNKAHKTARLASNSPNMLLMKMSVDFGYYHTQLKYPFGISYPPKVSPFVPSRANRKYELSRDE